MGVAITTSSFAPPVFSSASRFACDETSGSKYPLIISMSAVPPVAARLRACAASMILLRVFTLLFEPGTFLFQQVERGLRYSRGVHTGHAPMIDGTLAPKARAAFHLFANHARVL